MTIKTLIKRGLVHYWRMHLGVIVGAAVSTAVIVGALLVGDSVRESLRQITLMRLGNTEYALNGGERVFRSQLATELAAELKLDAAAVVQVTAVAIVEGGKRRVNHVNMLGIDENFKAIVNQPDDFNFPAEDEIVINERLARRLNLHSGDELLIRMRKLSYLPQETPLTAESESSLARHFRIKAIASDGNIGRFSLQSNQVSPFNIFIARTALIDVLGLEGRANLILIVTNEKNELSADKLESALKKHFRLADVGLQLEPNEMSNTIDLSSDRIFLEPAIVEAARKITAQQTGIFTYFVNRFECRERNTPYSFISTVDSTQLESNQIIINRWLADDLQATPGDQIRMSYFMLDDTQTLIERSVSFTLKNIVPMTGFVVDPGYIPSYPGLNDVDNCRDWTPEIPIDLSQIRDKDEQYWDEYRGTPKAFISLATAQQLWRNRFGELTAIRFSGQTNNLGTLAENLRQELDPASFGLSFRSVRAEGLRASAQATDFGQLFLGLSFFIMIAALILTGLLFKFNLERRSKEAGILLAQGFRLKMIKRIYLSEGIILSLVGGFTGAILGILYNHLAIRAMGSLWQGAIGETTLTADLTASSVIIGVISGILIAIISLWLAMRRFSTQPVSELQRSINPLRMGKIGRSLIIGLAFIAVAVIIFSMTDPAKGKDVATAFFSAGALLLTGGLFLMNALLIYLNRTRQANGLNIISLGVRNSIRRKGRSLAVIGMMALGIFMVIAEGANKKSALVNAKKKTSGTGGYALWGESVVPYIGNINEDDAIQEYIHTDSLSILPLRLRSGEDASCLNLNRVQQPRILGVPVAEFERRNAFTFVKTMSEVDPNNPWSALNLKFGDHAIPAIVDQTVIVWGLGKAVGDTLAYIDEHGEPLNVIIVAGLASSIFQGNILISEEAFKRHFPSINGSGVFLIDALFDKREQVAARLEWVFQDYGVDLMTAVERLENFNRIENTYLSIFLALGGLGLILGSIGLGIVVLRNIIERRGEIALLRAVGFGIATIRRLIFAEHIFLLISGIVIGLLSAFVAVLPALKTPGTEIPLIFIATLLLLILLNGMFWLYLATKTVVRGNFTDGLRDE